MRVRGLLVAVVVVAAAFGALAITAVAAWPAAKPADAGDALARVNLPGFAGDVRRVAVRTSDGRRVPVRLVGDEIWPLRSLPSGERLKVAVTVTRPGWAGWLVGHTEQRTFSVTTPVAHLRARWLSVPQGRPVTVRFDAPVGEVSLGGKAQRLAGRRAVVPLGVTAEGANGVGSMTVAAAARSWERLPRPVRVTWFTAHPYSQVLVRPAPGASVSPATPLTLTFSRPVASALGNERPRVSPQTSGAWQLVDSHTLTFRPGGYGFDLGATVNMALPRAVHLARAADPAPLRSLQWHVPPGSTLRLQQLLAELGYLPLGWKAADDTRPATRASELAAAVAPPAGHFYWRYPNTPPELQTLWHAGQSNEITRGAVMMFQDTHSLTVDALAGPQVWHALLADVVAHKQPHEGYSYVYVHRNVPQSLNLWHNGSVIVSSPGNTGVPAAPTQLGTFAVFEHIPVGTMSGTNPDGSHYNDPGIRWISYFNGGDAIHAFNRASFGTPQSLGCVELPLDAAARVWPYTPIGTLVTIEN